MARFTKKKQPYRTGERLKSDVTLKPSKDGVYITFRNGCYKHFANEKGDSCVRFVTSRDKTILSFEPDECGWKLFKANNVKSDNRYLHMYGEHSKQFMPYVGNYELMCDINGICYINLNEKMEG